MMSWNCCAYSLVLNVQCICSTDDVSEEPEVLGLPSTDSVSDKERQEL